MSHTFAMQLRKKGGRTLWRYKHDHYECVDCGFLVAAPIMVDIDNRDTAYHRSWRAPEHVLLHKLVTGVEI